VRVVASSLLCLLAACSSTNRVEVRIVNTTPVPLVIRSKTAIFSHTMILPPGGSWTGWVDRRIVGKTAEVVIGNK